MSEVTIKIKVFKDKDRKEFDKLLPETWKGTELYCPFCGNQTLALRCSADDKCVCLNCRISFFLNKIKDHAKLSKKDHQRLDILQHRYQELFDKV